jgi:hypothetical protein
LLCGEKSLIAVAAETMIPEAFHNGPCYSGVLAALGFAALILLSEIARGIRHPPTHAGKGEAKNGCCEAAESNHKVRLRNLREGLIVAGSLCRGVFDF